jgi:hypothetical protein
MTPDPSETPVERVVSELRARGCNPRATGPAQWTSRCPVASAHKGGDRNPSLSVAEGVDGKALITCHAGCPLPSVAQELGLTLRDLFPERAHISSIGGGKRILATYDYYSADGELIFQVVRYDTMPKTFSQRQLLPDGNWQWNTQGIAEKPLYHAPQVRAAVEAGYPIWIVEGEKDAENLAWHVAPGVTTTNAGGAGKWQGQHTEALRGASLVHIVADDDGPGRSHAHEVADALAGIVGEVHLWLPHEGHKDISEHLGAGRGLDVMRSMDEPATPELLQWAVDWSTAWATDYSGSDWILEPLIARGRGHALYAPAKTGKSLITLEAAAALATGRTFLDWAGGTRHHVLYVDYEMTLADLMERLAAFGYGPDDDLSHLHYILLPTIPTLDTSDGARFVVDAAVTWACEWVVIDTMGRAVSGIENDSTAYMAFARVTGLALKSAGIAYHRLDHAGKSAEAGQRGSSAKNDDVDVVQRLTRLDGGAMRLEATHRRMAWVPECVDLSLVEDDYSGTASHMISIAAQAPEGLGRVIDVLDRAGLPVDVSRKIARQALKDVGEKCQNSTLGAALKERKRRADRPSEAMITQLLGTNADRIIKSAGPDTSGPLRTGRTGMTEGPSPHMSKTYGDRRTVRAAPDNEDRFY